MAFGFGPHNDNFNNANFASEPVEREFKSSILLEKLYIHNFKSFYDSTFEFGKLNCLIAPNNTGKSNLIDALEFLDALIYQNELKAFDKISSKNFQNYHHPDDNNLKLHAWFHIQNQVLVGEELFEYDISLIFMFSYDFKDQKPNTDIWIEGKMKSIIIDPADLKRGFVKRVFNDFDTYLHRYNIYNRLLEIKRFQKFSLQYNHSTLRYAIDHIVSQKGIDSIANLFGLAIHKRQETLLKSMDFSSIFNKSSLFASHYFHAHDIKKTQSIGETPDLLEDGSNLAQFLSSLDKNVFEDIATSLIGEVELINGLELNDGFMMMKNVVFTEEINGVRHPVEIQNVSDGTLHFIMIMSAILGNRRSIGLLIEEPERHMHMKVLSYILNTMRDDDKQIFFTTHSSEFLNQLKLNEIIFMFRDYEGDTKSQRAEDIPNIKRFMKRYKNDLVEMIKYGVVGEYEE